MSNENPTPGLTILDGGMGRELLRIGAPFRQPEWSALALLEAPEFVRRVHDSFIAAGADVITTNSYAIVPFHLGEARFAATGRTLAERAGRLGRDAADAAAPKKLRLAGALPPPFGSYRPDLFRPAEAPRILDPLVAGLSPYVDLWLAETQSSTAEARAARAAIGYDDARPFWLSFTLADDEPASAQPVPQLRSGESIEAAARAATDLRAQALLFNCSTPAIMQEAVSAAIAAFGATDRPAIGVYANAFEPHAHGESQAANAGLSTLRDDLGPLQYLDFARRWRQAGASIIGGCCGIGPEYIAALVAGLR
jgi:homocysteine S-methyltransferase